MRDCLTKIERRQAIGRKLEFHWPRSFQKVQTTKEPATTARPSFGGVVAFAVFILAAAVAANFSFRTKFRSFIEAESRRADRRSDASKFASAPTQGQTLRGCGE